MPKKKVNLSSDENLKLDMTFIRCTKCSDIKAVRKNIFLARIEKYGSVSILLKKYLCRKCRNGTAKSGIQCVRCSEIKAVRKDVYKQRIKRYGSEKELLSRYLCRKCRKIVRHEKKLLEKKTKLNSVHGKNSAKR